jgi:3-isopropylmalate dehydrogenase
MSASSFHIAALAGDGIGPEVMREAIRVLRAVEQKFSLSLTITEAPVGWAGIDRTGHALSPEVMSLCKRSNAILFGSVGLPERDGTVPKEQRPERAALLRLRQEFELYANLRPVRLYPELGHACPLKPERIASGVDMLVIRELTGGLYFGQPKETTVLADGQRRAVDSMVYTTSEIERIARVAFHEARGRRRQVTSVDKANVLESSVLWREVVNAVAADFPDVTLEHMLADNAAMQMLLRPARFDVLLCENTFGDLLSDEAAALAGSLGMLPSASLGVGGKTGRSFGLYEPAGGTAPDIAGKGIANPIAQILSAALLLRHSLGFAEAADAVERAVAAAIAAGCRTGDIRAANDSPAISTHEMGQAIITHLLES